VTILLLYDEFTAFFVIFLICNDIPDCDEMCVALVKRLRCINFSTEFVDEPIKNILKSKLNILN
jgi:hypothetical protein